MKKDKFGGKVIASGGFGCVFSPSLKCKNSTAKDKNKITKLMTKKYALREYNEIKEIQNKLDKIPNYQDFFLINDFTLCEPEPLTKSDLVNYKKKCSALKKDKINADNINSSLDKIMALNMPNGGIPVDDYIDKYPNYKTIYNINNSLINLLKNGIIPMNEKNIYHSDIKDSNVLVEVNDGVFKTRLIDWGLTTEYKPNKDEPFPKEWRNRPLQFNVPFSVIIFTDYFVESYTSYLNKGGTIDILSLKPFVNNYLYAWIKKRGKGHYEYINKIMYFLFSDQIPDSDEKDVKLKLIETTFTIPYITNYIVEVLKHFTKLRKDGTLNLRFYLDTIYIKIVDVFGLVICYLPILNALFDNRENLNKDEQKLFSDIKYIFINYLYEPRIKPISISELIKDLKSLNIYLGKEIDDSSMYDSISSSSEPTSESMFHTESTIVDDNKTQTQSSKIKSSIFKKNSRTNTNSRTKTTSKTGSKTKSTNRKRRINSKNRTSSLRFTKKRALLGREKY